MSNDEERLDAHIPTDLKERLRQADSTQKEQVVEALEIYFGERETGNKAAIERQIQRYHEQRARAKREIQQGEQRLEEAETGIRRLEARLEALEDTTEDYVEALDELLQEMEAETFSVYEGHPSPQRIARDHDTKPSTVLRDLRERSDLHRSYFTQGAPEVEEELDYDYEINVGGPE